MFTDAYITITRIQKYGIRSVLECKKRRMRITPGMKRYALYDYLVIKLCSVMRKAVLNTKSLDNTMPFSVDRAEEANGYVALNIIEQQYNRKDYKDTLGSSR